MYKANMVLSSGGVVMGLSVMEISLILGIVYTSINLVILIFTIGRNVYSRFKDGKLDKEEINDTKQDINELLNTINELNNEIDKLKEHKDGNRD